MMTPRPTPFMQDLGGLRFCVFGDGSYVESPGATDQQVWDGNWHFVAGTYDGATVRVYVDGTEVGSGTPTQQTINYAIMRCQPTRNSTLAPTRDRAI